LIRMDRLDVIVAYDEKPSIGPAERAEPAVNGESLVERLQHVEGRAVGYAGLAEEQLLVALREQHDASVRIKVLGCVCGDDVCSSASVEVVRTASNVVWRNIRASGGPADLYAGIGPFHFDRAQYEDAIAQPVRSETPIRSFGTDRS
jgi:hypothetical protein